MPVSQNLANYADVSAVLRAAYQRRGGLYELETKGYAVHWRLRANTYKKLLQKAHYEESKELDYVPPLWIDRLIFTIKDNFVHIKLNEPKGRLLDEHGAIIEINTEPLPSSADTIATDEEVNDLLMAAKDLYASKALVDEETGEGLGPSVGEEEKILANRIAMAKRAADKAMEKKGAE